MTIDAIHFHSREHLSSTDHVFALIGRFLLTKDTRIERISSLGSTLEVQPVSGLVLGSTSWRLNWLGQGIFFKENPLTRLLVLCESDGHKVKHELQKIIRCEFSPTSMLSRQSVSNLHVIWCDFNRVILSSFGLDLF